ncbi:MAG: tetratricopeptide repeat protein [Prevotella sp.]|nr:tetratricopeptide repeat protein [Prevotella sp.]
MNSALESIITNICQRRLGSSINALENFLLSHPHQRDMEKLLAIKEDYRLMVDYWQRGFDDEHRQEVYQQLLHRLFVLSSNIKIHQLFRDNNYWMALYQRPRKVRNDWSISSVITEMENYVANSALLDLEPEHLRKEKTKELNVSHQHLMHDLFDYILTSRLWSDSLANAFIDILLSPTIDTNDQQLIISAVTLSAMNTFGLNKFKVLADVYQQTNDQNLRQRALVGWVLVMDEKKATLYPEMRSRIAQMCEDEVCRNELTELQIQLFYCMDAESDERKIREEIMPDIMSGSRVRVTRHGLEEMDDDTLQDIIHPETAERNIEKMEQSVQRMVDMQKQGSDIYFAGFSQMKRFPFFNNDLSNWFVPFYSSHPAIYEIWQNAKGSKLLQAITMMGAFCDSDKYSFVLAFEHVLSQLPANMLKMIDSGEATPMPIGGEVEEAERNSPAYIRRMYLQNLYRFFRLYAKRNEFKSPFEHQEDYLFFSNPLFAQTALEGRMMEIASFLMKRNRYDEAKMVMDCCHQDQKDYQYYVMMGTLLQRLPQSLRLSEIDCFRHALSLKPDDKKAKAGLARALFRAGNYEQALETYDSLLTVNPDSKPYTLNAAICLVNLQRNEEALKYLFKLNYLYPDDDHVNRVLAWVLTMEGKYEQAQGLFNKLLALEAPFAEDILNYGYCLWFAGDITNAIQAFRQFVSSEENSRSRIEQAFLVSEYDLIRQHHIGDVEIQMMLDALMA